MMLFVMFALLSEGFTEAGDVTSWTVQPPQESIDTVYVGVKVHN